MEMPVKPQSGANGMRYSSWRITQRILRDVCLLLLCIYLTYGKHPRIVCNTFATIPAAVITYTLHLKASSDLLTQKAILLYWSVHGVSICFDNAFGDIFGYFLAKLVLLYALLFYAVQTSPLVIQLRKSATAVLCGSDSFEKLTNQSTAASLITMRSTLDSFPFCESTMSTALSESSLETPMKTITKSAGHSTTKTIYDLLNEDFKAGDRRRRVAASTSIVSAATTDASTCIEQSIFEPSSVFNDRGDEMHFVQLGFNAVDGKSAPSDDCLIAAPAGKIIFKYPFNETITMALTNAHTKPVMWALKTNALRRIAAQPTCGVLPSHATVHLKIGLLEAPPSHTFGMDKMAIDYCIAEEGIALFDRAFMRRKGSDHRRMNISVSYIN
ncbi:hypothetical protein Tcan_16939 [Toxocara canis]|uniref:Major sperm protein n=1 Tax=Toxocara canis TaxID=6265 RepID=A0A0B2VES2_TOXCA|nr:hypothetical protein Tcan_16939 [Toxocara canis]